MLGLKEKIHVVNLAGSSAEAAEMIRSVLTVCFVVAAFLPEAARADELITVQASGVGIDEGAAQKDALLNAVKQAVGAYISAETVASADDQLEETVYAHSAGIVEAFDVVKPAKRRSDGLWTTTLSAKVKRTGVVEKLKAAKFLKQEVDGKQMWAQAVTAIKSQKDAIALMQKFLKDSIKPLLVSRVLDDEGRSGAEARFVQKPSGDKTVVAFWVQLRFDTESYLNQLLPTLSTLVPRLATRDCGSTTVRGVNAEYSKHVKYLGGNYFYGSADFGTADCKAEPDHFALHVLEGSNGDGSRLAVHSWTIDKEFSPAFSALADIDSLKLAVSLLDGRGGAIARIFRKPWNQVSGHDYENGVLANLRSHDGNPEYMLGVKFPVPVGYREITGVFSMMSLDASAAESTILPLFVSNSSGVRLSEAVGEYSDSVLLRYEIKLDEEELAKLKAIQVSFQ